MSVEMAGSVVIGGVFSDRDREDWGIPGDQAGNGASANDLPAGALRIAVSGLCGGEIVGERIRMDIPHPSAARPCQTYIQRIRQLALRSLGLARVNSNVEGVRDGRW